LLNAIVWTAGVEIPESGFVTPPPSFEELQKNLDTPDKPTPAQTESLREKIKASSKKP
jgi:hypothetical protein